MLRHRSEVRFFGLLERHRQNRLAALIINLNHQVILLLGRQLMPVEYDTDKDPRYPRSDSSGSLDVRQIIALRVLDPNIMAADKETVLGHG